MKETKEPIKVNASTVLLIITMIIIGVMAYLMYTQKMKADKEIDSLQDESKKAQTTINELQGKLNQSSESNTKSESDQQEATSAENNFNIYQENFKKTYKSVIAKKEGKTDEFGENKTDQFVNIPSNQSIESIRVESNGDAYYGENQKIDTNVASAHYSETGQQGFDIILIHRDGTAAKLSWLDIKNKTYQVTKIEKAKNIVNVISVLEYNEMDGGMDYYLVDINGNIIDVE